MQYLKLILSIAAALRAQDYRRAAQEFIALLTLVAGNPPPAPVHPVFPMDGLQAVGVEQVAAELESFAREYEARGDGLHANGEFLKKLFDLIVKVLPYILAGL